MQDIDQAKTLLGLTVQIVSAHVRNNQVAVADLPALIRQVHTALANANGGAPAPAAAPVQERAATPPVPKRTIFPDYIICLEDGRRMKTLKRHLRSNYDMSPEQYREKWGLPADYPMVAPNYAEQRSKLAKQLGLGRRAAEVEEPEELPLLDPNPPRLWQIVSAPEPAAPAPEARRPEPTVDNVFGGFPNGGDKQVAESAEEGAPRRPARKPFSKQLARPMRS